MPNPAPKRQRVSLYPTPSTSDLIFYETQEKARYTVPAYGTAHYDATLYPNHKLCFVEAADEEGQLLKIWYCANRSSQDTYNLVEKSFPYGNDVNFPRYTRVYVLPRGTASGESREAIALGTADSVHSTAKLVAQSTKPMEGQIGTLYEQVIRVFDTIPGQSGAAGQGADRSGDGQIDSGYTIERPLGDKTFLRLTWKLALPRTIADANLPTALSTTCPIAGFTSLVLINEAVQASDENNQISFLTRIYEGNSSGTAFPSTAFKKAKERALPGSIPPEKFITTITEEVKTTEISDPEATGVADAAPSGTLIKVALRPQDAVRGQKDIVYATATTTTLQGKVWDQNLEQHSSYTVEVVAKATADALTPTAGTELTVQPLNAYWSIVTRETPTVGTIGGAGCVTTYTTVPFTWPRVLTSIQWGPIGLRAKPGEPPVADKLYFYWTMKDEWSGHCRAKIETAFYATNPLTVATDVPLSPSMIPTPIELNWPGVAQLEIPACLHPGLAFNGTTGTNHPEYGFVTYSQSFAATAYTDWPASLIVAYNVKPYKNGYLVRRVTVYRPT